MGYSVTKFNPNKLESELFSPKLEIIEKFQESSSRNTFVKSKPVSEKYFDLEIKNKQYPSCYQYNVLIMLAKRLINEDKKNHNNNLYDIELNKQIVEAIANA